MKITLLSIACILTYFVNGQVDSGFTLKLTAWHGDGRMCPKRIDTVFLNRERNTAGRIYTNVNTRDSLFVIPNVQIGEYWLQFSDSKFSIFPIPIVVCSKCENMFLLFASPKKTQHDMNYFSMVEVSPGYYGDKKALSKDFQRQLSKAEKKKLRQSVDFTLNFYLTKEGIISDLSFIPSDLPAEIRAIITKGLTTVKNWSPAVRNGRLVDESYTLNKATLLMY